MRKATQILMAKPLRGFVFLLRQMFVFAVLGLSSISSFAYDGVVTGQIQSLATAPGGGYGFRVALAGSPALCGNAFTWAYLLDTDTNYKVQAALLLFTKSQGVPVTLYTYRDGSTYCQISIVGM